MTTQNNFKMIKNGRLGSIIYQSDNNKIEIDWEMSGVPELDILIAPIDLREWTEPKGIKIPLEIQIEILHKLRKWTKEQKIKTNIDLPSTEIDNKQCNWYNCNNFRLKGSIYCMQHYDENLLIK